MAQKTPKDTFQVDTAISAFDTYQKELLLLLYQQLPRLEALEKNLIPLQDTLQQMIDIARYPKRLPFYRDSFLAVTYRIRKISDETLMQMKDFHFQWFFRERQLMAIYTRFGELKIVGKSSPSLREFLLKYRQYLDQMDRLWEKVIQIQRDCDFLLTSKLN
ncbi:MAG: hypothetical protein ACUVRD_07510 [Bacteroidia bacterium]